MGPPQGPLPEIYWDGTNSGYSPQYFKPLAYSILITRGFVVTILSPIHNSAGVMS